MKFWQTIKNAASKLRQCANDPLSKGYLYLTTAMLVIGLAILFAAFATDRFGSALGGLAGVFIGPALGGFHVRRKAIKEAKSKGTENTKQPEQQRKER